jgi:hypothetical protein
VGVEYKLKIQKPIKKAERKLKPSLIKMRTRLVITNRRRGGIRKTKVNQSQNIK